MAELTEAVAEVAEGVADAALNVAEISRSFSGRDLGIMFVLGGSVGSLITAVVMRRLIETKYNQLAEAEISEMREHFRAKQVVADEKPDLERIVEERGYVPPPPGGLNVVQPVIDVEPIELEEEDDEDEVKNIFKDGWNYEVELALRSADKPYVIHQDEYSDRGFSGVTLTYYEGDDILCDEHNKPIDNKDQLIGEENLARFGHGSGNPNIVYIRNELLSIDIELLKDDGSYVEKLHGLKHSDRPRRHRFDKET